MRIKGLEIVGFKSFADKARLSFGAGITGVVGPNGCGKSNIVDAVRWCLGEMSAKHLRGNAMQDVIFAGSTSRGPMGMAEVTLSFTNDGRFPPAYAAYAELAVTRRLFRDGRSDYLLNGVVVRLKDIVDLFLGTGVGTRAYSVIEQGRIGFVVNAKPQERRSLIDEVAGITKFKARKATAERRMASTEQNLLRVTDIVQELERQLAGLRRQAKKAERYKAIKAELLDLDVHVAAMDWLRLTVEERALAHKIASLQSMDGDVRRNVDADEAGIEARRLTLLEHEEALQIGQDASAKADSELAALERDLEHWRAQLIEASRRADIARADLEMARTRVLGHHEERSNLEEVSVTLKASEQALAEQLEYAEVDVAQVRRSFDESGKRLEELRSQSLRLIQEISRAESRRHSIVDRQQDLAGRCAQMGEEKERLASEVHQTETSREGLQVAFSDLKRLMEEGEARLRILRDEQRGLADQIKEASIVFRDRERTLTQTQSRLQSLEQVAGRLEGWGDGVRSLMQAGQGVGKEKVPLDGIVGLVYERLGVASAYEKAIEASLAERLQYILVDDFHAADDALRYLKEHSGRAGLMVRDGLTETLNTPVQGAVSALDVITYDPSDAAIAARLLGDTYLVDTLHSAIALSQTEVAAGRFHRRFVTTAGDVVFDGVVVGGKDEGLGLLAQRREIRALEETLSAMRAEVEMAQEAHRALTSRQEVIGADIEKCRDEVRLSELSKLKAQNDLEACNRQHQRATSRFNEVLKLLDDCETQIAGLVEEDEALQIRLETSRIENEEFSVSVAALTSERDRTSHDLREKSDHLMMVRVDLAATREKLTSATDALRRLSQQADDVERQIENNEAGITLAAGKSQELDAHIQEGEARRAGLSMKAGQLRQDVEALRSTLDISRMELASLEERCKIARRHVGELADALNVARLERERFAMDRQRVVDVMADRHDVDLTMVLGDYHLRQVPGPEDIDRREQLDKSLKSMGSINLMAIEECAEVEGRFNFLVAQREDLEQAAALLKQAIARINRASRERFREAFDAVNETFQKMFPRLFRGGEARLELTESEDILEAGLEIFVTPPGKKLQSVSLLSGGEKALTATALVFSMFLVKPSPFCILDEVDAPLDDANVTRFNEVLREMSAISQFIVITHNKNTMTVADRIYGITMEETGRSKVVSVDLEGIEDAHAA